MLMSLNELTGFITRGKKSRFVREKVGGGNQQKTRLAVTLIYAGHVFALGLQCDMGLRSPTAAVIG